jgi:hypothetical protein
MFGSELPIFPKQIRDALWNVFARAFGCALLILSVLVARTVLFMPDNISTWTNFSTYPPADFFTKIIDL